MNGWTWLGLGLGLLWALDAVRLRRRCQALPLIVPTTDVGAELLPPEYLLWCAPGVALEAGVASGAAALAAAESLAVLDLVPERWNALEALGFLQLVDVPEFRDQLLAHGFSAGEAVLVRRTDAERAGLAQPTSRADLRRVVQKLKRYCPSSVGFAVAPDLKAGSATAAERWTLYSELFFSVAPTVLVAQLLQLVLAGVAAWRGGALGCVGLLALHLQALAVFRGGPVLPPDLVSVTVLAWPLRLLEALGMLGVALADPGASAAIEAKRPAYREALAQGTQGFFHPRRTNCPLCGAERLARVESFPDRFQHKPGRFTIEGCGACGHLFQNPQLNGAGLGFYYRDFYDGLGGDWLDTLFASSLPSYLARAREIDGTPKRWLDVGGGYGHQCLIAKTLWPATRFECLDVGEAVEEGLRRGWIDAAHRGTLPEVSATLVGAFDVVSLSHCLEHTPDPARELKAAQEVLAPTGTLIVEVPDPESRLRPLLRSFWMPYLQPQHLHLMPLSALQNLLRVAGFEVVRVRRGVAHTGVDFIGAALLILDGLAPPDAPWVESERNRGAGWRLLVWGCGLPLLLAGVALDALHRRVLGLPRMSNAYRVVARKGGAATSNPTADNPSATS